VRSTTGLAARASEIDRQLGVWHRTLDYYPPLARARQFVDHRLPDAVSAEQAAAEAHLERHYFSAYFHERVGVTFSEWLNLERLARALRLLEGRDDWSVPALAAASGFVTARRLQRAFRRYLSTTPTAYRGFVRDHLLPRRNGPRDE
jgi:AraC-like DNA-binding protein